MSGWLFSTQTEYNIIFTDLIVQRISHYVDMKVNIFIIIQLSQNYEVPFVSKFILVDIY